MTSTIGESRRRGSIKVRISSGEDSARRVAHDGAPAGWQEPRKREGRRAGTQESKRGKFPSGERALRRISMGA
jgi:hypothetical protein